MARSGYGLNWLHASQHGLDRVQSGGASRPEGKETKHGTLATSSR